MYLKDDDTEYYIKSFKNVNSVSFEESFSNYEVRLYFNDSHDDIILFYKKKEFAEITFNLIIKKIEKSEV